MRIGVFEYATGDIEVCVRSVGGMRSYHGRDLQAALKKMPTDLRDFKTNGAFRVYKRRVGVNVCGEWWVSVDK